MPTAIGKRLRSRKVQIACEKKRQSQLNDRHTFQSYRRDMTTEMKTIEKTRGSGEDHNLLGIIIKI